MGVYVGMVQIQFNLEKEEYKIIKAAKGEKTWKQFLLSASRATPVMMEE